MAPLRPQFHVVWAVDPYEQIGAVQRNAAHIARELIKSGRTLVTPVSVQRLPQDLPVRALTQWKNQFQRFGQEAVTVILKKLKVRKTEPPVVLFEESPSIPHAVRRFLNYTERAKTDLILVATRRKLGLRKVFDDSFAETLVYEAGVPVLVIGPQLKKLRKRRVAQILHPTDFGPDSGRIFEQVVHLAKNIHAQVTILHSLETSGASYHPLMDHFDRFSSREDLRRESAQMEAIAKRRVGRAKRLGVQASYRMSSGNADAARAILQEARRSRYSLIVMQDKSSPASSSIIGSNTRQIIRRSPHPVLVLPTPRRRAVRAGRKAA